MSNPRIRRVEYSELDACVQLIRASFGTVAQEFHLTRQNCPTNGAFTEISHLAVDWNNGNLMFGLYHDITLAGFMELELRTPRIYELKKLAVHPDYRHRGYGGRLLTYARQVAADAHIYKITLGMIEENLQLKCWYLTHGFIHIGTKHFEHLPFTVGFMEQLV